MTNNRPEVGKKYISFPLTNSPDAGRPKKPNHHACWRTQSTQAQRLVNASIMQLFLPRYQTVQHKRRPPLIQYHGLQHLYLYNPVV